MGILKISPQTSCHESVFGHSCDASVADVIGTEERIASRKDSGIDSGKAELAEVGCELNMSQGQLFNIPYELYDLLDLGDILSLETWNNCLTEEERFVLSAYLPDIDEEAFCLTMKELLCGNNMFFDSPLETFFRNLKGGLYHEKVTCYTSGLQFLQRISSCHSLRSYHENMVKNFLDMKGLWDACDSSTTVKERIRIWKSRNNHSDRVLSLDLNAYPEEEVPVNNEISAKVSTVHFSKTTKSTVSKRLPFSLPPPVSSVMMLVPSNSSTKGLLKRKSPGFDEFHSGVPKPTPTGDWVTCRTPAKGVLKVAPKGSGSQKVLPVLSDVSPLKQIPVSAKPRFSTSPSAMHRQDARDSNHSFSSLHTVGGRVYCRSPHLPDHVIDSQGVTLVNDHFPSSSRYAYQTPYISPAFISTSSQSCIMSTESTIPEDDTPEKVRRYTPEKVQNSEALDLGSMRTFQRDAEYYRVEQNATSAQEQQFLAHPDIIYGVPVKPEMNWEHSTGLVAPKLNGQSASSIGGFPITYKRRKLHTSAVDIVKTPTVQDGNHLRESVKTLKVKFRNWNNDPFQSEGILNNKPNGT